MEARLDVNNNSNTNGERDIQRFVTSEFASPVVFDVGANVGEWTESLLNTGAAEVHAFEPCAGTFAELQRRIGQRAHLVQEACSSSERNCHPACSERLRRNEYDRRSIDAERYLKSETVRLTTVGRYCADDRELTALTF